VCVNDGSKEKCLKFLPEGEDTQITAPLRSGNLKAKRMNVLTAPGDDHPMIEQPEDGRWEINIDSFELS
jgi:hypothetical protein